MKQKDFFGAAEWVSAADCTVDSFLILHGNFHVRNAKSVKLFVLGLGTYTRCEEITSSRGSHPAS